MQSNFIIGSLSTCYCSCLLQMDILIRNIYLDLSYTFIWAFSYRSLFEALHSEPCCQPQYNQRISCRIGASNAISSTDVGTLNSLDWGDGEEPLYSGLRFTGLVLPFPIFRLSAAEASCILSRSSKGEGRRIGSKAVFGGGFFRTLLDYGLYMQVGIYY